MVFDFVLLNASQLFLAPPTLDIRALENSFESMFSGTSTRKMCHSLAFDTVSAAGWVK
jgi:hypothetical protein